MGICTPRLFQHADDKNAMRIAAGRLELVATRKRVNDTGWHWQWMQKTTVSGGDFVTAGEAGELYCEMEGTAIDLAISKTDGKPASSRCIILHDHNHQPSSETSTALWFKYLPSTSRCTWSCSATAGSVVKCSWRWYIHTNLTIAAWYRDLRRYRTVSTMLLPVGIRPV